MRLLKGGKVKRLVEALESCGVVEFCQTPDYAMHKDEFDKIHSLWCNDIISFWDKYGEGFEYGRAAKLVNMYLKSMIVLVNPDSNLAKNIHPPIDSVLLKALAKQFKQGHFRDLRWTNFKEDEYFKTLGEILALIEGQPAWKIEKFWIGYQ